MQTTLHPDVREFIELCLSEKVEFLESEMLDWGSLRI